MHLVIGAGFVGQAAAAALAGRVRVRCVDPGDDLVAAMAGVEVVHLAVPLRSPLEEPPDLRPHPLLAAVTEAAGAAGVRRLVYLSTAHVLGFQDSRISERSQPRPRHPFERAVAADETWLREQNRVEVVTIRPAQVLAAGEPVIDRLLGQLASGRVLMPGGGRAPHTFVAGSDLGTAFAAAAFRGAPWASYLVGGFRSSWRELVEALAAVADLPPRLAWLPQEVATLAASARRLRSPIGEEHWPTLFSVELFSRPHLLFDGWSRRELGWWPSVTDVRAAAIELVPALRALLAGTVRAVPARRLAEDAAD